MAEVLQSSVGQMGRNAVSDVLKVQRRLIVLGYKIGAADGVCGRRTSAGILAFQGTFLKYPDGRVDPGGKTWNRMVALADAKRTMPGTVAISPGSSVR